jgi:hypothetical protein
MRHFSDTAFLVANVALKISATKRFFYQVNCGNSSAGRAQPCQGWGREFESRFPLQIKKPWINPRFFVKELERYLVKGAIAKRLCTGLQIHVGRFDSGSRLHF